MGFPQFGLRGQLGQLGTARAAGTFSVDTRGQFQLYGQFEADYGIAAYYDATPVAGDTGTMDAEGRDPSYKLFVNWRGK